MSQCLGHRWDAGCVVGALVLGPQFRRLLKPALGQGRRLPERIARVRKVEETANTDAQRKQAQREQQRIASPTAKLLTATGELIAKFKKNSTLR